MFNKITLYRISSGMPDSAAQLAEGLEAAAFVPTLKTQEMSSGWEPPRVGGDTFVEAIGGHWIAKLTIERRTVPSDALEEAVDAKAARIEQETGRKPGRKERRNLKDEALLELLPTAFPKRSSVMVWIDPRTGLMAVDATGTAQTDLIVTHLVRASDKLVLQLVNTTTTPTSMMGMWLLNGQAQHDGFAIGRECVLQSADEVRAVVRYSRHELDTDQVKEHVKAGKLPQRLRIQWEQRVEFTLTDTMRLLQIVMLDDTAIKAGTEEEHASAFDADVAIATGELSRVFPALIEALGGELQQ